MPTRLDAGIKAAVARQISRDGASSSLHTPTALDRYLTDPTTRNRTYHVALSLGEEDHPRRGAIGRLLLSYIIAFPPEGEVLNRIETMCLRAVAPGSQVSEGDADTFESLRKVVKVHLRPQPVSAVRSEWGGGEVVGAQAYYKAPQYTRASSYLPPTKGTGASGRQISVVLGSAQEEHSFVEERNRKVVEKRRGVQRYLPAMCKPYVDQTPLFVSPALLEAQIYTLGTYHEGFSTNPTTVRASNTLLKLLCDGYVRKLPLCTGVWGYSMLREVSVGFVRTFLKLMDSDYSCCRTHVYTLLLTLSLHLQLVDPQGLYPGLGAGLEEELVWLVSRVLEKQSRMLHRDEMLWLGALKCCLACVPPAALPRLDGRALRIWMGIGEVAVSHPHVYSTLAKALSNKLLGTADHPIPRPLPTVGGDSRHRDGADSLEGTLHALCSSGLSVSKGRVGSDLGPRGMVDLIELYRSAHTTSARLHLFTVLFSLACNQQEMSSKQEVSPEDRACCLRFLVGVGMHWQLHTLVLYQSHSAVRSLPQQLRLDMDGREVRDLKGTMDGVLAALFDLISAYRRLPELITNMLSSAGDDIVALNQVGKECCVGLPALIKEDVDGSLVRIAMHTTHHLLRILRSQQHAAHTGVEDASGQLIATLSQHASTKVRGVVVDALGPHSILCRTNPTQASCYTQLLESAVNTETDSGLLMGVYHTLVGSLVMQGGPFTGVDDDVSSAAVTGGLHIMHGAADLIGAPLLWKLYCGLRRSEVWAAQRARHVLLSIISALDNVGAPLYVIYAWSRVMSDPYPPAALVGAQKIIRVGAVYLYERYEAAVSQNQEYSSAQKGGEGAINPFRLATSIWGGVEAEARGLGVEVDV